MQLVLNEDQELIQKTALDFVEEHSPVTRMRALRDADDPIGFSKPLWKEMAELGWVGIPFPESVGGAGMGFAELSIVAEALGRKLAPEPLLSTVGLAGQAVLLGGSEARQQALLPGLVAGDTILALAWEEAGVRFARHRIATRAAKDGDGWVLDGSKVHVLDAPGADHFVVAARTEGEDDDAEGISLFLLPAGTDGLSLETETRVDAPRRAGTLGLSGVRVGADALLGVEGEGGALLERVIDRGTVVLCAEMLGGMSEAFDLTLAYMKERKQFDQVIGSFQALKHRAAELFIEIELARSAVMAAARAVDEDAADLAKLVSLAKARCSDAYVLAGNEGVQIFAGVGMTDEYDIGLYLKRARAAELSFGDAAHHRDRWARLSSY